MATILAAVDVLFTGVALLMLAMLVHFAWKISGTLDRIEKK